MAEITAAAVKELRERTGLGMMECKKALEEAGGDGQKAEELLRIKSGAKASKAASRVAAEGVIGVYISPDAKCAGMVEVNCETDFVAKNQAFLRFAGALAERVARDAPADVAALSGLALDGETVEKRRQTLVHEIGENMSIRRFHRIESAGQVTSYLHGVKIGVLVEFEGDEAAARDVAMQVAFAKPLYLRREDVDPAVVEKERQILKARAAESGKPAEIIAKMVEGGVNKFVAENTLLGQPFVKDDKQTVEKMLAAHKTRLLSYRFFVVGEGIERKQEDFAEEVRKQAQQRA
jgi:elongation factor Ts